jgi:hypothetical protein
MIPRLLLSLLLALPLHAQSACYVSGMNSNGTACSVHESYMLDAKGNITSFWYSTKGQHATLWSNACLTYQGKIYYGPKQVQDQFLIYSANQNK